MATSRSNAAGAAWAAPRAQMVDVQCRRRGIRDDAVLAAMAAVPRHAFVPAEVQPHAYDDRALPIGHEQTISQPYIVAAMTAAARVAAGDRVLDVGTGSGYQAAVLAEIGAEVFSIERIAPLAEQAATVLRALGYTAVRVRVGDGSVGWADAAPFDAIVVAAAAPSLPPTLARQLVEGGRLVIPEGPAGDQRLVCYTRRGNRCTTRQLGAVRFVPLIGAEGFTSPPA